MKMTENLKSHLVEHCGVDKDASEDDFRKATGEALANGSLTVDQYSELTAEPDDGKADEFTKRMDQMASNIEKLASIMVQSQSKEQPKSAGVGDVLAEQTEEKEEPEIRVKGAHEQYSTSKSVLTYPERTKMGGKHSFAGQPVQNYSEGGRPMDNPSERDKAVIGVWSKFLVQKARCNGSKTAAWNALNDHEKQILQYAMHDEKWCGANQSDAAEADIVDRKLTPSEQKALIDDGASGGLEAAPIVFDDQVISAPLLTGELYPLVNVVPVDRGRRIEGVVTTHITGAWGGIDATAIAYFNTANYVTAFNTDVERWQCSVQIGLDFLSDTPIDFGAHLTAQIGERLAEDLDDAIADGNGTNAPEGVFRRAGLTTVAWGGATSLGNYESLFFSVPKQELSPAVSSTAVFCGNLTSYQRARAIPVGGADARRIFGMDYESYSLMGHPYKISGALANTEVFFAVMARYRMYRRRGLTVRMSTEGDTNIRNNVLLICATARFGGRFERSATQPGVGAGPGARTTTAEA